MFKEKTSNMATLPYTLIQSLANCSMISNPDQCPMKSIGAFRTNSSLEMFMAKSACLR